MKLFLGSANMFAALGALKPAFPSEQLISPALFLLSLPPLPRMTHASRARSLALTLAEFLAGTFPSPRAGTGVSQLDNFTPSSK